MKPQIVIAIFSLVLAAAGAQAQTPDKQNHRGHQSSGHRVHRHNNLSRIFSRHGRHEHHNRNIDDSNSSHRDSHNDKQSKH
jgi:hypothetical protein